MAIIFTYPTFEFHHFNMAIISFALKNTANEHVVVSMTLSGCETLMKS